MVADELCKLGLRVERFSKDDLRRHGMKTPDFKVFRNSQLVFFCEVKEITDADPLEARYVEVAPGLKRASQLGDSDSPVNRVILKAQEAIEQFCSVDPEHKELRVLALVNTYDLTGPDVLLELLQGHQVTDSGMEFLTTHEGARKAMQTIASEIDLYWWLERHAFEPRTLRIASHAEGSLTFQKLESLFESPAQGKSIGL